MKFLAGLLFCLLLSVSVSGQPTKTISQLQAGDHKFAKGAILVSLNDTVSSDFVEKQFEKLGFNILQNDIKPVYGFFMKKMDEEKLAELSSHPYTSNIEVRAVPFDEESFLRSVKEQNLDADDSLRHRNMLISVAENPLHRVYFKYYVTEEMARTFNETIPEFEMKINPAIPRSVIIETIPGKENEVMEDVRMLVYVRNTAYLLLNDPEE